MALSWGRREGPPSGPSATTVAAFILVLVIASMTSALGRTPEPPPNAITPTLQDELQQVLELHYAAVRARDRAGFAYTIDPHRPHLRRCLDERFDLIAELDVAPATPRIVRIEPYRSTYVRAYVHDADGVTRVYFRRTGLMYNIARPPFEIWRESWRWYVSEPLVAEQGEQRTREVDGAAVTYRAADEEIVQAIGEAASAARAFAMLKRPLSDPGPFNVRLVTTRDAAREVRCQLTGGTSQRGDGGVDIVLFEMRFSADLRTASGSTRETLRHEALHWLQHEIVRGLEVGAADWWIIEGYAHRESGTDRGRYPRGGCTAGPPAYAELAAGPGTVLPITLRSSDLYAYAARMIDFLYERYGTEAYWSMIERSASPPPGGVLRAVLGVEPDAFRDAFAAWARAKYCR